MPTIELIKGDRKLDAEGREAFLLRTRDAIAQYRAKLEVGITPQAQRAVGQSSEQDERELIAKQIATWERQLDEALGRPALPPETAQPFQETTQALVALVSRLKDELAELKAKVTGQHGAVSERETPPEA